MFSMRASLFFNEVGNPHLGPNYSHDGGGSSCFFPQERNQRAVFS
jgi:hypothetical protein